MTPFWKYSGLGNDFLLFEQDALTPEDAARIAPRLCDRRRGLGADGLLILGPSSIAQARMVVINADGSRPEMCGNGLRCAARFVVEEKKRAERELTLETDAGVKRCRLRFTPQGCDVTADMGAPRLPSREQPTLNGASVCIQKETTLTANAPLFTSAELTIGNKVVPATALSMGNPHLILFDVPQEEALFLAPRLEVHPMFPQRTNVEFARAIGPRLLELRVWERGCGWTQACGTGACAAAVAARLERRIQEEGEIEVRLPGGSLYIDVAPAFTSVCLRGPADRVVSGALDLAGL